MSIDMTRWNRAPSNRKPTLPPMEDVAAMIAGGELLEDIAATFGRSPKTLMVRLNHAGYSSETGFPTEQPATIDLPTILGRLFKYQTWRDQALCAQTDPEAFFPEKGASTREAKAVCRRCPVQAECIDEALATGERFGIWGGLSERERRKIGGPPTPPTPADKPCRYPECDRLFPSNKGRKRHEHLAHHLDNQQEPA